MGFYDFTAKDIKGREVSLGDFQGKVVLVVNTASNCGFTPQYKELEELYQRYKERGLVILGFPCNQFGGQEPGTAQEIQSFCELNYGVTFPLFEKIEVNGSGTHPLFKYLKKELPGKIGGPIKWNFTKFLLDSEGKPIKRFAPSKAPNAIEGDIQALLTPR